MPSFCASVDGASVALLPAVIADSDFSRAVGRGATRIGYRDMADFAAMNAVYARVLGDARPARSTVAVEIDEAVEAKFLQRFSTETFARGYERLYGIVRY